MDVPTSHPPLLEAAKLDEPAFTLERLTLRAGGIVSLQVRRHRDAARILDLVLGLADPGSEAATIRLFGHDLSDLAEAQRLALLADVCVINHEGDLIPNLRVWENVVLQGAYHRRIDPATVEADLVALFTAMDLPETWMLTNFPRRVAGLSPFDRRAIGLARACVTRPRLLVVTSLFDQVYEDEIRWLNQGVAHLASTIAGVGILAVGVGASEIGHFGLKDRATLAKLEPPKSPPSTS